MNERANPTKLIIELLGRAIAYEQDAFEDDEEVSGADLVQFFSDWRTEAETVLSLFMRFKSAQLAALIDLAALARDAVRRHERDGIPDGQDWLIAWCDAADRRVKQADDVIAGVPDLMDTEEFNKLLNGPLHHPLVPFVITRLSLALSAVVAASPAAAQVLRYHCEQLDAEDRRKGASDH